MIIQKVAVVGMGALGLMYGELLQGYLGRENFCYIMDADRFQKNKNKSFYINGKEQTFVTKDYKDAEKADLIIIATKYNGLTSALDIIESIVGSHTVIVSLLNGISSEKIIAERYGDKNLVPCVAIGMDAMREDNRLHYTKQGKLQIGTAKPQQQEALQSVVQLFDAVQIPYTVEEDIQHALWAKFLLNVGVNQTCMVYDTTYEGVLKNKEIFETMSAAMYEVIAIAQKEGVSLTKSDYDRYIKILYTLNPDGYPSMRQDALAKRLSEVDLFAGTVIEIASRHNVPVPVNEAYYKKIKDLESSY